jgi:hypothetical protein
MRKSFIAIIFLIVLLSVASLAQAATEAQKQMAIDNGLAYLASIQQSNGSWWYGGGRNDLAATGSALLAFTEQYYKPAGWNANYSGVVTNALDYLLKSASTVSFSGPNWWGYQGSLAGQYGLHWGSDTYATGIVLPSIARVTSGVNGIGPNTVINLPGYAVNGMTYREVVQRTMETFIWGQTGPGSNRYGGWRYAPWSGDADNSTAQWPVIAALFSQNLGVNFPAQTKTALQAWINAIQTPGGGSDYQPGYGLITESKTGGLLLEMVLAGGGGNMANAFSFINDNWQNGPNSWNGNFAHPYAMWSIYKGLEATIGLDDMGAPITNLHPDPGDVDNPNHGWNWYEDYCHWLANNQNPNGSWSGYWYWTDPLATAWNINILNGTRVVPTPVPGTLLLLGSGLFGLGVWRQRMKK